MTSRVNRLGQPIGPDVPGWTQAKPVEKVPLTGRYVDVVPLRHDHGPGLFAAFQTDPEGRVWTYMPIGPFPGEAAIDAWLSRCVQSADPLFYAIIDKAREAPVGVASFLRMAPKDGAVEVGYLAFSPLLQKTRQATEAMYLMMAHVFDQLGYRRYEWKCDALNAGSRKAAARLGFVFEGVFRQATVYKGRNRDTAWFAVIDADWPRVKAGFDAWLCPDNFDTDGQQKRRLQDLMEGLS